MALPCLGTLAEEALGLDLAWASDQPPELAFCSGVASSLPGPGHHQLPGGKGLHHPPAAAGHDDG